MYTVSINATFDPTNAADLAWLEGEINKIMIEVPEIKLLENKLGMMNTTDPVLNKVIDGLKSAGMVTTYTKVPASPPTLNTTMIPTTMAKSV